MSFSSNPSLSVSNQCLVWSRGNNGTGRVKLQFPMEPHWYNEQACTKFCSLQHRKERSGVRHEFIVLELTNGSICRVERMGDPDAPLYSLSPEGIRAHDIAQCFSKERIEDACLNTSEIVSQIFFPILDLKDVLYVCRAIHEAENTHNYTLRGYNCYFFALTIQTCLTRRFAGWEDFFISPLWHSKLDKMIDLILTNLRSQPPIQTQKSFALIHLAGQAQGWDIDEFYQAFVKKLRCLLLDPKLRRSKRNTMFSELWHVQLIPALHSLFEKDVKYAMVLTFAAQVKAAVVECHDAELRSRRRVVIGWLNMLLRELEQDTKTNQTLLLLGQPDQPDQASTYLEKRPLSTLSYYPPSSLAKPDIWPDLKQPTSSQWCAYAWANLGNTLQWFLWVVHGILSYWGVSLMTKRSPEPCLVIEHVLEEIASDRNSEDTPNASELDTRIGDLFKKYNEGTASWEVEPWYNAFEALKVALLCDVISLTSGAPDANISSDEWYLGLEQNAVPISTFQKHIRARIGEHAKLVGQILLAIGPVAKIQTELEQKMSEIWKLVRDHDDKNRIFAPALAFTPAGGSRTNTLQEGVNSLITGIVSGFDKVGLDFFQPAFHRPVNLLVNQFKATFSQYWPTSQSDGRALLHSLNGYDPIFSIFAIAEDGAERDLQALHRALTRSGSYPTSVRFVSLSRFTTFNAIKAEVKKLYNECKKIPDTHLFIYLTSYGRRHNRIFESLSGPTILVTILLDTSRGGNMPIIVPPKGISLVWACSIGENAGGLRVQNNNIPHSCFLIALMMSARTPGLQYTSKVLKGMVQGRLDQLMTYLKEVYSMRHPGGRCSICSENPKPCDEPTRQNIDWEHAKSIDGVLELTKYLSDSDIAEEVYQRFMSNVIFLKVNNLQDRTRQLQWAETMIRLSS